MFLFHQRFKQEYPQVSGKVNQLLNTEIVKEKKKELEQRYFVLYIN